jgi:hypothetical protein
MLVHKIYLIVWLELDSNLFGFNRLSLSLEKKKEKELSLSLFPLGRFLSLRPTLHFFSPLRGPPSSLLHVAPLVRSTSFLTRSQLGPAPPAPRFPLSSSDQPGPPIGALSPFPFFFPRITGRTRAPRSPASPPRQCDIQVNNLVTP